MASVFTHEDFDEHVQRIGDKEFDWSTFQRQGELDPKYARAHVRMVGGSITGVHDEPGTIRSGSFVLSVMMMPPGGVAPSHAHEVEEVFYVVKGSLTAWWEHDDGSTIETVLGENEMIFAPPGVMHGLRNHTDGEAWVQVIIGAGKPEKPSYLDGTLAGT